MSNFAFLQSVWPDVHADAVKAESYMATDPRSACFYARRTVEQLVAHLYDVMALPLPYSHDLAARLGDPAFQQRVGVGIGQKFYLLRKAGNAAVHDTRPIRPDIAQAALRELHHVLIWAAFHYSTQPDTVPKNAVFDTRLTVAPAPRLTREQVTDLNAKLQARDEAHAKQLAELDDKAAQLEAELNELRAAVAEVQAAKTTVDDRDYDEADTRRTYIDVDLAEAGWTLTAERDREYKVEGLAGGDGVGFIDYVLWGSDDLPLAIVEAKRTSSSPQVGQQQAKFYADALEAKTGRRPVIFLSNGYTNTIWDDAASYPPREIQGFYTRDELELMIQRRRTRSPLADAPVKSEIVERIYQQEAIKAVGDAFDRKQRAALLVMATGTGKTRVAIALIDQLMNRGWVRNVLFLADRKALVRQAANNFKAHLPSVSAVNLLEDRHGTGRVVVSTYPTMMGMIGSPEDGGRRFGPGHFDLIVIDETHRSIYQKYGAIFSWFDALRVGLTATPKDEVDHNTYRLFHLEDGVPTYAYDLTTAVDEDHLVGPRGVAVGTKFMRDGIKYHDLSADEKDAWDSLEWGDGDIPDEVDPEALNRFLFNEDTVDKVLATLMRDGIKVAGGDRLGKTIIFAKSQKHAEFIRERFDAQYPEYGGTFARVITHAIVQADKLIDDFTVSTSEPHIAISVDMLDTGIDVPEVVNLVFFKLVRSSSKFWQMIGRGTRLSKDLFGPGLDKTEFLVFDFCGNLEFFSQGLPGSEGSVQKSLTQRLFEGRVALVAGLDRTDGDRDLRASTTGWLARVVAGMNPDNALVRPHRQQVEAWSSASRWQKLDPREVGDVAAALGGLPSSVRDSDEAAKRFDLLILTRQLAQLEGDRQTAERVREKMQEIASALLSATSIPSVAEQQALLEEAAGDDWWVDVTLPMLELARLRLRALVRFVPSSQRVIVYTDFEDELVTPVDVDIVRPTPGTDWARFRQKATAYLREHDDHVSLQRLRRNRQLTAVDIESLEQMLIDAGIAQRGDIARAAEESNGLGLFIRSLVGLDRSAATEAFGGYLDEVRFTIDQVRFIGLIVDELTRNGVMEPSRLFESPFIDRAPVGPSQLFSDDQVDDIVNILGEVKHRAGVA